MAISARVWTAMVVCHRHSCPQPQGDESKAADEALRRDDFFEVMSLFTDVAKAAIGAVVQIAGK